MSLPPAVVSAGPAWNCARMPPSCSHWLYCQRASSEYSEPTRDPVALLVLGSRVNPSHKGRRRWRRATPCRSRGYGHALNGREAEDRPEVADVRGDEDGGFREIGQTRIHGVERADGLSLAAVAGGVVGGKADARRPECVRECVAGERREQVGLDVVGFGPVSNRPVWNEPSKFQSKPPALPNSRAPRASPSPSRRDRAFLWNCSRSPARRVGKQRAEQRRGDVDAAQPLVAVGESFHRIFGVDGGLNRQKVHARRAYVIGDAQAVEVAADVRSFARARSGAGSRRRVLPARSGSRGHRPGATAPRLEEMLEQIPAVDVGGGGRAAVAEAAVIAELDKAAEIIGHWRSAVRLKRSSR